MSTFLFATLDAGGNLPPALLIGAELMRSGHSVRFMGHPAQSDAVRATGADFVPYRSAVPMTPTVELPALRDITMMLSVFTDAGIGRDVVTEARRDPPDLLVIDCLLFGALGAAAKEGLAYVSLVHSFYAFFDGPFRRNPISVLARLKGLGPRQVLEGADLVLVCADPDLDPAGRSRRSGNVVWAGAAVDVTAPATPPAHPHVLVSLSTTAFPGQPEVLQRILDAVADLPIDVTVTTGPAVDPGRLSAPPNVAVHRYIPHTEVMPHCSAVLGHGGHATTMRALAHGLPMLIVPMHPMLDQPMIGKVVQEAGAGLVLGRRSSGAQIAEALMTILDTDSYAAAAGAIGERLRAAGGARTGALLLEGLVERAAA
ncbi:glycosyltransferase [Arthrobacter agilis]|uniref:glycosyltransferase n=1 Tax=Arthrobacter agilis TaxID=37921 RepID=UPI0027872C0D|nr:nucleotide disphospho-sugar-binding domain-containing protein [Arthrobacter agilis]MDQ0735254.1 UDP:flavonoid glycosyltransferase YjiC (YdhE family) [Arthrobacter agilis]